MDIFNAFIVKVNTKNLNDIFEKNITYHLENYQTSIFFVVLYTLEYERVTCKYFCRGRSKGNLLHKDLIDQYHY